MFEGFQHIGDDQEGGIGGKAGWDAGDHGGGGTFGKGLGHEVMAVADIGEGHEQIARLQAAGVDRDAVGQPVAG